MGALSPTMKQGITALIPKPGKDPTLLDNLRPITLLNNDYKLLLIYSQIDKKLVLIKSSQILNLAL